MFVNNFFFVQSLELLDKTDPPGVPEGYGVSLAFRCLMETTRTVNILVMGEQEDETQQAAGEAGQAKGTTKTSNKEVDVTESCKLSVFI